MSPITEAERQVLIALIELAEPIETPNNSHYSFYPSTLDEAAAYFHTLRENWDTAYLRLIAKELIQIEGTTYQLTDAGAVQARRERLDHPPIWYWYREYYTITARSPVYSRFCQALYGYDLCQTNFSDMAQLEFLIQSTELGPDKRALDLGCGKGLFAEYISDCTGARVWGVDYVPEAIQQALERTAEKRGRLDFQVGNFDHLDFANDSFDLITSIDTLYMPNDLPATLCMLRDLLAPGGKMLIYYSSFCFDPAQSREILRPHGTDLARALTNAALPYRTWDFTRSTFDLMRRKHRLARAMRAEFEAEGTLFLYEHLLAESDSGSSPFDPQTVNITRYLYEVTPDSKVK